MTVKGDKWVVAFSGGQLYIASREAVPVQNAPHQRHLHRFTMPTAWFEAGGHQHRIGSADGTAP